MTEFRIPADLAPESRLIVERVLELGTLEDSDSTVEEMRAQCVLEMPLMGAPLPVSRTEDVEVPGPGGPVPVRLYWPGEMPPRRILQWIHGGGWVLGDLELADPHCRRLCRATGALVVSVDYRLAPEHPYPAGLEDCYTVLRWISTQFGTANADGAELIIGGDSSGGNLAAAVCLLARDGGGIEIDHQLLIYPVTDHTFEAGSYREFAEGYILETEEVKWFSELYLGDQGLAADPLAAPLRALSLRGLPPATVVVAGCDVLRDDAERYARRLQDEGVRVEILRYPGQIHGFWSYGGVSDLPERVDEDLASSINRRKR